MGESEGTYLAQSARLVGQKQRLVSISLASRTVHLSLSRTRAGRWADDEHLLDALIGDTGPGMLANCWSPCGFASRCFDATSSCWISLAFGTPSNLSPTWVAPTLYPLTVLLELANLAGDSDCAPGLFLTQRSVVGVQRACCPDCASTEARLSHALFVGL